MKKKIIFIGWAILFAILQITLNGTNADGTVPAVAGIEGIQWLLVEVSDAPVSPQAAEQRPYLKLDAVKKQVIGFAECNNFFGTYEIDETVLKFGPVGSTRMSCADLQMGLETEVFKALESTRSWAIRDNALLLFGDDNDVMARFTATPLQQVSGQVWQWVQTRYSDDRQVVPADFANYTVQFNEDGTLSMKADCNQKGGTYSVSPADRRISIKITHSTMAVCPDGSLEDEFVRTLSAAANYFFKEDALYIDLQYDSGTMKFSKQKTNN